MGDLIDIELGDANIVGGLLDEDTNFLLKIKRPTEAERGSDNVLRMIAVQEIRM